MGKMIQFHRKKSGFSREQLAQLAGIGKTALFDLEKGKPTVRMDTFFKVLFVLNIHIDFKSPLMHLFDEEGA